MNILKCAPVLVMLAACAAPVKNATRQVNGQLEVQLVDGDNCYSGRCFRYFASTNRVSTVGRRQAAVPPGITANDGFVTAAEFHAMYEAAFQAEVVKRDN